jgi:hypothetical protein
MDDGSELLRSMFFDPTFRVTFGSGSIDADDYSKTAHFIGMRAKDSTGEYSNDLFQGVDFRDSDQDTYIDLIDVFPDDPFEWRDTDGDGIGNNSDPDLDGDGLDNAIDPDDDNDGLSDSYELANNLDPNDPVDAPLDPDNDGLSTLAESLIGTDPNNPDTDMDGIRDGEDPTPLFAGAIDEVDAPVDIGDRYGASVAVGTNWIAAGSPSQAGGGVVYLFSIRGSTIVPQGELAFPVGFGGSAFGSSVAMLEDDSRLFVGAPGFPPGSGEHLQGAIYERSGDAWNFVQDMVGENDSGQGQFGISAGMEGDLLVVGAPRDNEGEGAARSGAVYLFQRTGGVYIQQDKKKIQNPTSNILFGQAVDVSGSRVVVGAPNRVVGVTTSGEVSVYEINAGQLLNPQSTVGSQSASAALFGFAVTMGLNGATLWVGAPGEDNDQGAAYVFFVQPTTLIEIRRIQGGGTVPGSGFGSSISFDGTNVIVGSPGLNPPARVGTRGPAGVGAVYHYSGIDFQSSEETGEEFMLQALDGQEGFGAATALSGDRIVIGSPQTANDTGAVAVHRDVSVIFGDGFEG